jgi:hypothetical protein
MNQPLRSFVPALNAKPRHRERRTSVRCACHHSCGCHYLGVGQEHHWPATIQSISSDGLSLVVCHAFRAGEFLAIELDDAFAGARKKFFVRVKHATAQGDSVWTLGCRLVARFRDDELDVREVAAVKAHS